MKEQDRHFFIRFSPSFGLTGLEGYKKFKEWELITGLNNLEYLYDKDNALVIKEIDKKDAK